MIAFESTEIFDYRALMLVVDNWSALTMPAESRESYFVNGVEYSPIAILRNYLKCAASGDPHGSIRVTYVCAKGQDSGRRFAKNALSMQGMARCVRHTLAKDVYEDIDMVNAHPVILEQLCVRKGVPCRVLAAYNTNRDQLLAKIVRKNPGTDKAHAKKVVLALMNGGVRDFNELEYKPKWLEAFREEVTNIHAVFLSNPEFAGFVKATLSKKGGGYSNLAGSVCNKVLCSVENQLLMACIDFVRSQGHSVDNVVLVFDGFMLPKKACPISTDFLAAMSDHVFSTTKFRVKLVTKAMDEPLDLTGLKHNIRRIGPTVTEDRIVADDNHAASIFGDMIKDVVKQSHGRIFVKTWNDVWTCDPQEVRRMLIRSCTKADLYKIDDKDNLRPYSNNLSGAKAIIDVTLANLPSDNSFSLRLWQASIGKVFFKDGVYDFIEGRFRPDEPDRDMTTVRIDRVFPVRDPAKMAEVREKVLKSILGTDEAVECYLAHVARAMAGMFEDKHWVVLQGERNSGKGTCETLNRSAWTSQYVSTLNSDSFLMQSITGGDEAKKLSWLLDCEFTRMIFTNEITVNTADKKNKMNGNVIKGKIASGGDVLYARKNYQDEIEFRIQGRLFMMCNDLPPITPADTMETMHMMSFPYQYVEKLDDNSLPFMRVRDDKIKSYCAKDDTVAAYIHLVLDAFTADPVKACPSVARDTIAYRLEGGDEWTLMREFFTVTKVKADRVSSADVSAFLKAKGMNLTPQKARKRLEMMGAKFSENMVINGQRVRGFLGVKLAEEALEEY
jgi:hypothetical protein